MKHLSMFFLLVFIGLPTLCKAEWMSEVDKRYQTKSPSMYSRVQDAQVLISGGRTDTSKTLEAIAILHSVISEDKNFAPAYTQLARASSNLGIMPNNRFDPESMEEMEKNLQRALEIEPDYDYAIALMGFAKMFQGDLDAAERYYTRAEEMGSNYPFLLSQRSQLATKRGDYNTALGYAMKAYEQNQGSPGLAESSINEIIFALQKMPGDTLSELEKWHAKRCELAPTAWNWQAYAGFRLYRIGDYETSIEYGTKALSLMDFGIGRYTLAAAYYKKWSELKKIPSRSSEATAAYDRAASLFPANAEMLADFDRVNALRSTAADLRAKAAASSE
jgi:tetratricopeptide (TPR) repeat protein